MRALVQRVSRASVTVDGERVAEIGPGLLVLLGITHDDRPDTRKGNRPAFIAAARPEQAEPLYERFCDRTASRRGRFGAHMDVELVNDGPVTLLLELP